MKMVIILIGVKDVEKYNKIYIDLDESIKEKDFIELEEFVIVKI